jgi:hypothetical protein
MKNKMKYLLAALLMASCSEVKYDVVSTQVVEGKVSYVEPGRYGGRTTILPVFYIQNSKNTIPVSLDFKYEDKFKVGDSITLVIQKVKEGE